MITITLITNIPAPYRLPIYELVGKNPEVNFTVIFAAKNESNRSWDIKHPKFNHLFLKENVKQKKDGYNYVHNNLDVLNELKKINPDVVITTGFNPTHLYAFLYAKLNKKKHIPMTDGWIESEKKLSLVHKAIRKIVFIYSHAFIGASKNSLSLYRSYGINNNKLFQSHLCIDNNSFATKKTLNERKYDLMFSGQLVEGKLPFLFAEIAEKVSKIIPNIKILILGDGPLKNKLISKLDEMNIDYYYGGFVSQEELPSYYSNSKLFLFTTRLDAWGIVANEALASGTPVISTPYAGVVDDLLIDNKNGYILEAKSNIWSEKVIEILNNPILWEKLSQNSKESVKDYNFNNAANGIVSACEFAFDKYK